MGKKKVTKQSDSELIRETGAIESAMKKIASGAAAQKHAKTGRFYVQATYNNTVISATDNRGNVIAWASAGALGFKGAKKATPYAASKVVEAISEKIKKAGVQDVEIYVKGVGAGRESAVRSIVSLGMNVSLIADTTPLPHNGCRSPKVRRV